MAVKPIPLMSLKTESNLHTLASETGAISETQGHRRYPSNNST